MKRLTRKQGISLLLALVLVLAGAGGAKLWQKHTAQQDPVKQNAALPASEGGKYLVIPEWGVRFKLNDNIRDARYQPGNDSNSVYLSTISVEKVPGCKGGKLLAAIDRAKNGEALGPTVAGDNLLPQAIKIDDYYYLPTGAQQSCANLSDDPACSPDAPPGPWPDRCNNLGTPEAQEKVGQVARGFSDAFKTLEKIPIR